MDEVRWRYEWTGSAPCSSSGCVVMSGIALIQWKQVRQIDDKDQQWRELFQNAGAP